MYAMLSNFTVRYNSISRSDVKYFITIFSQRNSI